MISKPHALEHLPGIVKNGAILHYTCNPPSQVVLDFHGIRAVGADYDIDPREVLLVPKKVYNSFGFAQTEDLAVLRINMENIMRRLR